MARVYQTPQFLVDDTGARYVGMKQPDGTDAMFAPFSAGNRTAILLSDSIGAQSEVILAAASVTDNNDGTATVVISGGHAYSVGQPVRIGAAATQKLNALDAVVTQVDSSTQFRCSLGGRTHAVTSPSSPTIAMPHKKACRGFLTVLETLLGYQFDTEWCAVGGATASRILDVARISRRGPFRWGFVCAGMNNVYSAAQSFETAQAEIKALIDYAVSVSGTAVVLSIPPRDSGGAFWSSAKQIVHNQLNWWMWQYCAAVGAVFINTWRAASSGVTYVNGGAANPDPTALMTFDGTHPSFPGAVGIANEIIARVPDLSQSAMYYAGHLSMFGADVANILTDSDFASGASTPTGWSIANLTTNASATGSMESRTVASHGDAVGRNALVTFNYGTASGQASFRFTRSSIHSLLIPGKRFRAMVPFSVTGATDLQGIDLLVQGVMSGGQSWFVYANSNDSNVDGFSGNISGVLVTPEAVVPSGVTSCTPFVRPLFGSGQSGNAVLRVWHPLFAQY